MEMDENRENHLLERNSVLVGKAIYASIMDLNKKRKLEDDQLGLPLPKHKFGNRISGSEQEEHVSLTCIIKENTDGGVSDKGSEQLESSNDTHSVDSPMSLYPEAKYEPELLKVYTYNQPAKFATDSPKTHMYDQPSTSSGSCGSNSFTNIIHALDSKSSKKTSIMEEDSPISKEPGAQSLRDGLQFEEDELPGFRKYADCLTSEYGTQDIEECSDVEINEMMLYSNQATSNSYVLSSGRWEINQGARVETKKPTIDQEFEQYFSMLML